MSGQRNAERHQYEIFSTQEGVSDCGYCKCSPASAMDWEIIHVIMGALKDVLSAKAPIRH